MRKKVYKIIFMLAITLNLITIINNYVYAVTIEDIGMSAQTSLFANIQKSAEEFLNTGKENQKITPQTAKEKLLPIAGMLVGIATVVFLVVGGILGIQYMMNGADERAQLKQKLIWFVIAVVAVYGAAGIFNIAVSIMTTITGE